MKCLIAIFTLLFVPSMVFHASAQVCADSVQGTIAWDGGSDTSWTAANVETLCSGATDSLEPGLCFQRIMSGTVNWGGGTNWNPVNALNLCKGSVNASATVTCFENQISASRDWRTAIENCQPNRLGPATPTPPSVTSGTPASGLPAGDTFGTRTSVTTLGGETLYRISCRDCSALYCQPGDEIVSNGGACEVGVVSRLGVGQLFDGPCASAGCWIAFVGCRGTRFEALNPTVSRSRIQAMCIEK